MAAAASAAAAEQLLGEGRDPAQWAEGGQARLQALAAKLNAQRAADSASTLASATAAPSLSDVDDCALETLHPGDGVHFPQPGDIVHMHYVGTLQADGYEFDSSRRKQKEFATSVGKGRVIRGWEWAMPQMSLGQRCRLTCGPESGYGEQGVPGHIPPGATLLFDIQLLAINDKRCDDAEALAVSAAMQEAIRKEVLATQEAIRKEVLDSWDAEMQAELNPTSSTKKKKKKSSGNKKSGSSNKKKKKKKR